MGGVVAVVCAMTALLPNLSSAAELSSTSMTGSNTISIVTNPTQAEIGTTISVQPPQGFSMLNATPAELAQYGFPQRPTDSASLALWTTAAAHALHAVDPPAIVETGISAPAPSSSNGISSASNQTGQGWSGHVVLRDYVPSGGAITVVGAEWGVPPVPTSGYSCSDTSAPAVTEWVGIDGVRNPNLTQAGTQELSCTNPSYRFFTEYTVTQPGMVFQGPAIAPQQVALVWVSHPATGSGTSTYLLENVMTGDYQVKTLTTTWEGDSADFVVERPLHSSCLFGCDQWFDALPNYGASMWGACFYKDSTGAGNPLIGGPQGNDVYQMYEHANGGAPQLVQTSSVSNQSFYSTFLNTGWQIGYNQ
jgi:hypothetical protein